jgi:hypothetical protein
MAQKVVIPGYIKQVVKQIDSTFGDNGEDVCYITGDTIEEMEFDLMTYFLQKGLNEEEAEQETREIISVISSI